MFNYFGSKQRLASTYAPPRHDLIVEPFAGAGGYAMYWLKQRPRMRAILVELDPLIVRIWELLLEMTPEALWNYPDPEQGQKSSDLLWASANAARSSLGVLEKGGEFQVTEWQARDFPTVKRRMAHDLALVQGRILVIQGSYEAAPDIEATWFIDPPYQHQGLWYGMSNDQIDYRLLGHWVRKRQGQVIVCEAAPADWLDFTPHRIVGNQVNTKTTELVWESDPEPSLLSLID